MNGTGSGNVDDRIGNRSRANCSFFLLSAGAILALDCATKTWARRHLSGFFDSVNPSGPITLMLEQNRAGAFGLMLGTNETVNRVTFSLLSLISIAAVVWLFVRLRPRRATLKWGLPLVLGGALGNLLDRLYFGHVLDFIDLHVLFLGVQRRAPRFNLADAAITIGVSLMAVEIMRHRRAAPDSGQGSSGSAQPTA